MLVCEPTSQVVPRKFHPRKQLLARVGAAKHCDHRPDAVKKNNDPLGRTGILAGPYPAYRPEFADPWYRHKIDEDNF